MGEFDNKPTGEADLLEEDGTVWVSAGANDALDDDDDLAMAAEAPPERAMAVAPTQPYLRQPSAPPSHAMPPRFAGPRGADADRPIATSGETGGARVDHVAMPGRARPSTLTSPFIEPSVQVSLPEAPAPLGTARTPALARPGQPRHAMPVAPRDAQARWRLVILLAILALAIAALVWRLVGR